MAGVFSAYVVRQDGLMSARQDPETRLATYGTLAPGQPNAHQLENLSGEWTAGVVRRHLREQGWGAALGYPGLVLAADGNEIEVHVLTSPDLPAHWERLDEFEGVGYRRVVAPVKCNGEEVSAQLYVVRES
jgi:gamma-glutamylcyclotransferase (GGCT)/AIG2-like uncharacterized protein YtfP